ncbi:unnamed protein product [Darwinula stevensoni]|uniref:NAD-dependent protein deacylase n=1 Tax=Darwinula stevensoni TaxID=69355 RepID=A0A7R8X5U2_9CRUS|nr:unnamed protein product [Darwinula stevensoni]CAG0880458.1 unnamed protein product [Darwinula stevensoni]
MMSVFSKTEVGTVKRILDDDSGSDDEKTPAKVIKSVGAAEKPTDLLTGSDKSLQKKEDGERSIGTLSKNYLLGLIKPKIQLKKHTGSTSQLQNCSEVEHPRQKLCENSQNLLPTTLPSSSLDLQSDPPQFQKAVNGEMEDKEGSGKESNIVDSDVNHVNEAFQIGLDTSRHKYNANGLFKGKADEVEALSSIYGKDFTVEDESTQTYSISICCSGNDRNLRDLEASLQFSFPAEYPSKAPPDYQLSCPWLRGDKKQTLCCQLEEIYWSVILHVLTINENPGESIIYMWVQKIEEFLSERQREEEDTILAKKMSSLLKEESLQEEKVVDFSDCPPITHGGVIVDRKSTFQAHLVQVTSLHQVKQVFRKLLENRKIADATHNIYAYRIFDTQKKSFVQDCDDDGETHAGSRVLHLLQIIEARDVLVVVSRWYGGTLLGPDRFKHINNAARMVLQIAGFIPESSSPSKKKGKLRVRSIGSILAAATTMSAKAKIQQRPSSDMAAFREVFQKSQKVVVLTGAGVSAESGVPTFRGPGGYWRMYQAPELASPMAFRGNPSLVWEFYHYRRELMASKEPNPAHIAIAECEKRLQKEGRDLVVITQNIDGLHARAGSSNIIELHGNLFKTKCLECGEVAVNTDSPICPALEGKGVFFNPESAMHNMEGVLDRLPDPDAPDARIPEIQLPRCKKQACGGLLRPYVVWFGEALDPQVLDAAHATLDTCDLCLVVGTSSVVYPAAMFAPQVARRGIPVAEFNIEPTPATHSFGSMRTDAPRGLGSLNRRAVLSSRSLRDVLM